MATAYPATSQFDIRQPRDAAWRDVYAAARRVLATRSGRQILAASYEGAYVDEYQDCTTDQHGLVLAIDDVLPTRILGDPLQGIFDFGGQRIVDWNELDTHFQRLPDLDTPWRWRNANRALGEWLLDIRAGLLRGERPDFSSGPIRVDKNTTASQVLACGQLIKQTSVVAIRKFPRDAHDIASKLGGNYTSMEEMESKDLLRHAEAINQSVGPPRALAVIDFAALCVTQVGRHLATAKKHFRAGALPSPTTGAANSAAVESLCEVVLSPEPAAVASALAAIARLPDSKTYRRELLTEMQSTLRLAATSPGRPWSDVAWDVRDRARRNGRTLERRIVSRTLLIKGLEFDHAVVLNADELDVKNLYVALTRGSKTLTVLTAGQAQRTSQPWP